MLGQLQRLFSRRPSSVFGLDPELAELARKSATDDYQGPREEEPYVRVAIANVKAEMVAAYRANHALHEARAAELRARQDAEAAAELQARVYEETEADIAARGGVDDDDPSVAAQVLRVRASRAAARRREVTNAVRDARRAHEQTEATLRAIEERTVDELGLIAERAIPAINAYLAAFDSERVYLRQPGLGPLDPDFVRRLVQQTLASLTATTPDPDTTDGDQQ